MEQQKMVLLPPLQMLGKMFFFNVLKCFYVLYISLERVKIHIYMHIYMLFSGRDCVSFARLLMRQHTPALVLHGNISKV